MTYLAILAIRQGRRPAFIAVAGVALGLSLLGLAAALGMAAAVAASPMLYALLRWGGVVYLFYIAWESWRDADKPPMQTGHSRFFVQGLVTNLLNPKAALVFVAVMPGFLAAGDASFASWALFAGVYVAIATLIHLLIVAASGSLAPWLERSAARIIVARGLSLALAGVAVWLAWATA